MLESFVASVARATRQEAYLARRSEVERTATPDLADRAGRLYRHYPWLSPGVLLSLARFGVEPSDETAQIASVLEVTAEFLLTESTTPPGEEVIDEAFFRKYKSMPEGTKKRLRKILDAWDDDE